MFVEFSNLMNNLPQLAHPSVVDGIRKCLWRPGNAKLSLTSACATVYLNTRCDLVSKTCLAKYVVGDADNAHSFVVVILAPCNCFPKPAFLT